jgi:hypothetical protein
MRGLVLTEGLAARFGREAFDDLIERMAAAFKYWIVDAIDRRAPPTGAGDDPLDRPVPARDTLAPTRYSSSL